MAPSTLFVSNFPFATAESDLRSHFEAHCPVNGIRIITDRQTGRSRGFAFIEVPTVSDADAAIQALNESMYNGRRLVVSHAKGRVAGDIQKAPNAEASATPAKPFKHRIIIDWCEEEGRYSAEVPDFGVTVRAETIPEAIRQVQALTQRSAAAAGGRDG